jgi:hypothetical protein
VLNTLQHKSLSLRQKQIQILSRLAFKIGRLEKFSAHKDSQCHKLAVMTQIQEPKPVNVQLSRELERQQQQARRNLRLLGCVKYLARQGQAFRDVDKKSENFSQLLKHT